MAGHERVAKERQSNERGDDRISTSRTSLQHVEGSDRQGDIEAWPIPVPGLISGRHGGSLSGLRDPVHHAPSMKSPIRRLLEIEKDKIGSYSTIDKDKLPVGLTIPKKDQHRKDDIVAVLQKMAENNDTTFPFTNWTLAVAAAIKQLDDRQADAPVAKAPIVKPPPKTVAVTGGTFYVTAAGEFCDQAGDRMSTSAVNGMLDQYGWTHIYTGHGPKVSEASLRSAALTKGVSGRWISDDAFLAVLKIVTKLIDEKVIIPSPGFKVFDIPVGLSVNFRKKKPVKAVEVDPPETVASTKKSKTQKKTKSTPKAEKKPPAELLEPEARQAKVGFKKHDKDGEVVYVLKTLFPYPDRPEDALEVDDDEAMDSAD